MAGGQFTGLQSRPPAFLDIPSVTVDELQWLCRRFSHSPALRGKRVASHGEGHSTLDVPLIHEVPLQDQT